MDWRAARISIGKGGVVRRASNKSFVIFKSRAALIRISELEKSSLLNNYHKTFIKENCDRDVGFEGVYLKYDINSNIISQYEPSQKDKTSDDWEVIQVLV